MPAPCDACSEFGSEPVCVPQVFMDWTLAVVLLLVPIPSCQSGKGRSLWKLVIQTEPSRVWLRAQSRPGQTTTSRRSSGFHRSVFSLAHRRGREEPVPVRVRRRRGVGLQVSGRAFPL